MKLVFSTFTNVKKERKRIKKSLIPTITKAKQRVINDYYNSLSTSDKIAYAMKVGRRPSNLNFADLQ